MPFCLQLEVYYRYLPTYQKPEELDLEDEVQEEGVIEAEDIDIEIEGI